MPRILMIDVPVLHEICSIVTLAVAGWRCRSGEQPLQLASLRRDWQNVLTENANVFAKQAPGIGGLHLLCLCCKV